MAVDWKEKRLECGTAGVVPARVYRDETRLSALQPAPPLVLHLHGGAFLGGSQETGHLIANLLAEAGAVVASVDYSKANEKPFPAALDFAFEVLRTLSTCCATLAERKSFLFVAGEEAGGNLAAGLALMARDQGFDALAGQILLSPMLDPCMATGSYREAEAGASGCKWSDGWNHYLGQFAKACHPYAAPALSARLAGLVPALVITADDDPMRDESLDYARRLREAGGLVQQIILTGPTGWPETYGDCPGSRPEWEETIRGHFAAFLNEHGPYPNEPEPSTISGRRAD